MEHHHYSEGTRDVIQGIFSDLTQKYLRERETANYHLPDHSHAAATSQTVVHISEFLRPCFTTVFSSDRLPCQNREEFSEYVLSLCESFLRGEFLYLTRKVGHDDINFVLFLLTCSFLSELVYFFVQKDCYRHLKTIPKCMILVYDRWFKTPLEIHGGLDGLIEYCDNMLPLFDSIPNRTGRKLMGFHELSPEVKEIQQRIVYCSKEYNRVRIVLNATEKQLIAEDKEYPDTTTTPCCICGSHCKYYLISLVCPIEDLLDTSVSSDDGLL